MKINGIWDPTMYGTCNAMLSLVMLAPIYSIISDMSLTWVFKIIYPLLFSLVPLGLYRVFQKQTDEKIAFLACFFFVSLSVFYGEMLALARQQIAELFLVLLILLMINKSMDKIKRSLLFIVFGISLVVSHYGLSYIYMFCLISAWLILVLADNPAMQRLLDNFYTKFSRYKSEKPAGNPVSTNAENRTISSTFVLLFIIFTLTWYMYVSSSSAFNSIVYIGDHISSSIFTDFLNPEAVQGLEMMTAQTAPGLLHEVCRIINYLNQIFIILGCITLLLIYRELKFEKEYAAFSMVNLAILFAAVSVPFFASSLNMTRVYQITLIFLAPFCVIGGITVLRAMSRIVRVTWTDKYVRSSLKVLSVYFVIFLLYNSGFIWVVAEGHSGSISLGQESIKEYGDAKAKVGFYNCYIPEQNVFGARWLSKNRDDTSKVYADYNSYCHVLTSYGGIRERKYQMTNTTKIDEQGYIYLGYLNLVEGIMSQRLPSGVVAYNTTEIYPTLEKRNRIYANGGSHIYR
jgi:uncharacterized membrane protein